LYAKGSHFCEPVHGLPKFRKNPTFPELAFRFLAPGRLPKELHRTYDVAGGTEKWEKRAPIGKHHYNLLKKTECDAALLERSYGKWVEMAKHRNSNPQLNQLFRNALNFVKEKKNHEDIRRGYEGTDEEKEKFKKDWMKKGMSAIRKTRAGEKWGGFQSEDCYKYQKLGLIGVCDYLDYRHPAQIDTRDVDLVDVLLGPRDRD
jgi:hypothetical protein